MRVRRTLPQLGIAAGLLALGLVGCKTSTSPEGGIEKPRTVDPAPPPRTDPANGNSNGHGHGRGPGEQAAKPLRGTFEDFEPLWHVGHRSEQVCNGLFAGAEVTSAGIVSHLGRSQVRASAAWDWGQPAAGLFAPDGPVTAFSASIISGYPHTFCSQPATATGRVTMVAANGDEVHGVVVGGEVYELGFDHPGDGQEQFMVVRIEGGTGRFEDASGNMVIHSIVNLVDMELLSSHLMPGAKIRY